MRIIPAPRSRRDLGGVSQDDGPDPILRVAVNPLGFENILVGAADETCNDGFTDHVPSLGCTRLYGCLPVSTDGNNLSSWVGLADADYFGRTLAFRVPTGAFGGSFSVARTQGYYDPRLFTDLKLTVTLNFDACPHHGHDVQNC